MKKFRIFDICFLGILGLLSYVINIYAFSNLHQTNYFLQFTVIVTFLSVVRWGRIGIVTFMIANLPSILLFSGSVFQFLLYSIFVILAICGPAIYIEKISNEQILDNKLLAFLLLTSIYVFESFGSSLYFTIIEHKVFIDTFIVIFVSYIFQIIINFGVYMIIRNTSSLFYDLKAELERTEDEWEKI